MSENTNKTTTDENEVKRFFNSKKGLFTLFGLGAGAGVGVGYGIWGGSSSSPTPPTSPTNSNSEV